MKTEQLKEQGLTDEQISFVMKENGKDISKAQKEVESLTADRDAWKEKAETAEKSIDGLQEKLDGFKDINVDDLKGQIATLTADLNAEKEARAHDAAVIEQEKTVNELFESTDSNGKKLYPFLNEITRNHYKSALMEELDKDTAKGKSVSDLFKAMITEADGKTKDGIFRNLAEDNRAHFTAPAANQQAKEPKTAEVPLIW